MVSPVRHRRRSSNIFHFLSRSFCRENFSLLASSISTISIRSLVENAIAATDDEGLHAIETPILEFSALTRSLRNRELRRSVGWHMVSTVRGGYRPRIIFWWIWSFCRLEICLFMTQLCWNYVCNKVQTEFKLKGASLRRAVHNLGERVVHTLLIASSCAAPYSGTRTGFESRRNFSTNSVPFILVKSKTDATSKNTIPLV